MIQDFSDYRYQDIVKATVSGVFEDLKFKISEGLDQNRSCPESALLAVSAKLAVFWKVLMKLVITLKKSP